MKLFVINYCVLLISNFFVASMINNLSKVTKGYQWSFHSSRGLVCKGSNFSVVVFH